MFSLTLSRPGPDARGRLLPARGAAPAIFVHDDGIICYVLYKTKEIFAARQWKLLRPSSRPSERQRAHAGIHGGAGRQARSWTLGTSPRVTAFLCRSEVRRGGTECVSKCKSRLSSYH